MLQTTPRYKAAAGLSSVLQLADLKQPKGRNGRLYASCKRRQLGFPCVYQHALSTLGSNTRFRLASLQQQRSEHKSAKKGKTGLQPECPVT